MNENILKKAAEQGERIAEEMTRLRDQNKAILEMLTYIRKNGQVIGSEGSGRYLLIRTEFEWFEELYKNLTGVS